MPDSLPSNPTETLRSTQEFPKVEPTDTLQVMKGDSTNSQVTVFFNLIHGEERRAASKETFSKTNPASPQHPIGKYPASDVPDVRAALESNRKALAGWQAINIHRRAELVAKLAGLLEGQSKQLARTILLETGKTAAEAQQEVRAATVILRHMAALVLQPEGSVYHSTLNGRLAITRHRPLGVAAIISPFNFPLALPCWKIAPALIAGNTVLFKPSELAPHTGSLLGMMAQHAGLPPGVLNVVHGVGSTIGEEICTNPIVSVVSFTGRQANGRRAGGWCGKTGKRFQIETSGKNAVIIMPDADLEQAVEFTLEGAFRMAGQKCLATARALVHERVYDDFNELLQRRVAGLTVGEPQHPKTFLGPMISDDAVEALLSCEQEAISSGATRLGEPAQLPSSLRQGFYVTPRVLLNAPPTSRFIRSEVYGPILGVNKFREITEALQSVNELPYGLSTSIMTRDLRAAMTLAENLDVGIVRLNGTTTGLEPHVPISCAKESGVFSVSFGRDVFEFFSQLQTLYVDYN